MISWFAEESSVNILSDRFKKLVFSQFISKQHFLLYNNEIIINFMSLNKDMKRNTRNQMKKLNRKGFILNSRLA